MTKEEVVEELQYIHDSLVFCELSYEALEIAIKTLSADVIEVVRCKDCKYADGYHHCNKIEWWNNEDDFCSKGERRKL